MVSEWLLSSICACFSMFSATTMLSSTTIPIATIMASRVMMLKVNPKKPNTNGAAESEIDQGPFIAATSLAIHAAINAADAVCGARLGHRASGEDHDQALVLLRQAGPDGAAIETDLRRYSH